MCTYWRVFVFLVSFMCMLMVRPVHATSLLKLPYAGGESMLVSRGYETAPTHVNKDKYALDFVQGGCRSFGSDIRAVRRGVISFINTRDTWGGGYGKNIILDHGDGTVSRYAHMNAYASGLTLAETMEQGQLIGYQGNTGNVVGKGCAAHPGTHLHFSLLQDGFPVKPEPISTYTTIEAGKWYLSDNYWPIRQWSGAIFKKSSAWMGAIKDVVISYFASTSALQSVQPAKLPVHTTSTAVSPIDSDTKQHTYTGTFVEPITIVEVASDAEETTISISAENTGSGEWNSSNVFLNVIGGSEKNAGYYHPSWITPLRPASVTYAPVYSHGKGTFSFIMRVPYDEYAPLQLQLVRFHNNSFSRISTNIAEVRVARKEQPFEKVVQQALLYIPEIAETLMPASTVHAVYTSSPNIVVAAEKPKEVIATSTAPIVANAAPSEMSPLIPVVATTSFFVASSTVSEMVTSSVFVPVSVTSTVLTSSSSGFVPSIYATEIAWMGTSDIKNAVRDCSQHEWLELYNSTKEDISLHGWQLEIIASSASSTIPLSNILPADGHGIIMRQIGKEPVVQGVATIVSSALFTLPDEGALLRVRNAAGDIVYTEDFRTGWGAGSGKSGMYRPMELIGNQWKTNAHVTPFGSTAGCGQLVGSPGRANRGYTLLRDIVYLYAASIDTTHTLTLTPEGNPYVIDTPTAIPFGYTLIAQPGVKFIGRTPDAAFKVAGTLLMKGVDNNPVSITSDAVAPQAGEWSHIHILPNGTADLAYVHMTYGGHPFSLPQGALFGSNIVSRVLFNQGGTLRLDHVSCDTAAVKTTKQEGGALVWTEPTPDQDAETTITKSKFHGGYEAIHHAGGRDTHRIRSVLDHISAEHFSAPYGPIHIEHDMPNIQKISLQENISNTVYLHSIDIFASSTIPTGLYVVSGITIHASGMLEIEPGNHWSLLPSADIVVRGLLTALGTESMPIHIKALAGRWGSVVIDGGTVSFAFTSLEGGGLSTFMPKYESIIAVEHGSLLFDQGSIKNGRIPGSLIEAKNSQVTVKNSALLWNELPQQESWITVGMRVSQGKTIIDNTSFHTMSYGIHADADTAVVFDNMTEEHMQNISIAPSSPENLWSSDDLEEIVIIAEF